MTYFNGYRTRAKVVTLSGLFGALVVFGCVAAVAGVVVFAVGSEAISVEKVSFTVTGTERACSAGGSVTSCYYRVFAVKEGGEVEVFVNRDGLLFGKVNSADFQAVMRDGAKCEAVARGFRVPLFSVFRNLYEVRCVMAGAGVVTDGPGKAAP